MASPRKPIDPDRGRALEHDENVWVRDTMDWTRHWSWLIGVARRIGVFVTVGSATIFAVKELLDLFGVLT